MTHFPPLWISFPYRLEFPVGQEILALTSSTPCPTCPHQCQRDSRRLNAQGRGKSPQSSKWPCQRGYPSMEPQELSLRIASASPNHEAHQAVLNSKLGKIELRRKRRSTMDIYGHLWTTCHYMPAFFRETAFIREVAVLPWTTMSMVYVGH